MHGVEPQPVEVEVAEPHQRVVDDEPADRAGVLAVEVDPVAPVVAARGEVRAESRQVVAARSEVVVDDVQDDGQAVAVGGVDEALEAVRAAVGLVRRVPVDAVVAPAPLAAERVHRHELDVGDAEFDQVRQALDGGVECAAGGERADVQLVDDRARQGPAGPRARPASRSRLVIQPTGPVYAVRLPARTRIGQHRLVVVEQEAVVGARRHVDVGGPPAVGLGLHQVRGSVDPGPHPLRRRRPDPQFTHSAIPIYPRCRIGGSSAGEPVQYLGHLPFGVVRQLFEDQLDRWRGQPAQPVHLDIGAISKRAATGGRTDVDRVG